MESTHTTKEINSKCKERLTSVLSNVKYNERTYAMFTSCMYNDGVDVGITIFYNCNGMTLTVDTDIIEDAARCAVMNGVVNVVTDVFNRQCEETIRLDWNGTTLTMYIPEESLF